MEADEAEVDDADDEAADEAIAALCCCAIRIEVSESS
jgi:hypothetical protein